MNRRLYLAALSGVVGALAGCLESDDSTAIDDPGPLDGRYQHGYDAGNSRYAVGLAGPTEKPTLQRRYTGLKESPLTADGGLYTTAAAVGFDGDRRWDPSSVDGDWGYRLAPAIYEDSVVSVATDEPVLQAFERADGTEGWQVELSEVARGDMAPAWLVVLDDRAYYPTSEGVGCVDLDAREEAWQAELTEQYEALPDYGWHSPAATEEHVYALNAYSDEPRRLYALDPGSGAVDWTADLGFPVVAGFMGPAVGQRYVFVLAVNHPRDNANDDAAGDGEDDERWVSVVAIDPADGEIAWTTPLAGLTRSVTGLAAADDRVYVTHGGLELDEPPWAGPALLTELDAADGTVEWTTEIETNPVRLTVTGDLIFVVDSGYCLAVDRDGGDVLWRLALKDAWETSDSEPQLAGPPVVHDGRLFLDLTVDEVFGFW